MRDLYRYSTIVALCGLLGAAPVQAGEALDQAIRQLQGAWAEARYQTPAEQQEAAYERLEKAAEMTAAQFPDRAEPLIWQAIILSSHAGASGGLAALGQVRQARALLEQAEALDAAALDGSIYTSLGSLYYQVPGWPLGYGDDDRAETYLKKALALNPDGIDPNYFYGDYLYQQARYAEAVDYLGRALAAAPRPGRELADRGRRAEAQSALERARARQ
jgi:tetratricopeptide (TPR) repeat protein